MMTLMVLITRLSNSGTWAAGQFPMSGVELAGLQNTTTILLADDIFVSPLFRLSEFP